MIKEQRGEPENGAVSDLEISLLLEGVFQHRGFDFRAFDPGFLRDRIFRHLAAEGLATVSALQEHVLHDPAGMERFLQLLMAEAKPLFSEPRFFSAFRRRVIGLLRPLPSARVWVAESDGSTDAYSLSILLAEANLKRKVRLYATVMDEQALQAAKTGVTPLFAVKGCSRDYRSAGGKKALTDYCSLKAGHVRLRRHLCDRIVWAHHNLVTDASFNQFHCIVSRNTLDRFSPRLRQRVGSLFYESLTIGGVLGVGSPDDFRFAPHAQYYEPLDKAGLWYKKTG